MTTICKIYGLRESAFHRLTCDLPFLRVRVENVRKLKTVTKYDISFRVGFSEQLPLIHIQYGNDEVTAIVHHDDKHLLTPRSYNRIEVYRV